MHPTEAQAAILAYLAQHGETSYQDMLNAIDGVPADRVSHYLFSMRKQHKIKMAIVATKQADGAWVYAHTVKGGD